MLYILATCGRHIWNLRDEKRVRALRAVAKALWRVGDLQPAGKMNRWLLLLTVLLMATTGHTQKSPRAPAAPTPAKLSPDSERWVAQTLKKMSLDEKIGQVFAVWAYGSFISTESPTYRDLLRYVEEKHIGSIAIQTQG